MWNKSIIKIVKLLDVELEYGIRKMAKMLTNQFSSVGFNAFNVECVDGRNQWTDLHLRHHELHFIVL